MLFSPLRGLGSGAAFSLEDGWIPARAIEFSRKNGGSASDIFDSIRSPYYARMYTHLDTQKNKIQKAKKAAPDQSFAASLQERINAFGGEDKLNWINGNDIEEFWREFVERQEGKKARFELFRLQSVGALKLRYRVNEPREKYLSPEFQGDALKYSAHAASGYITGHCSVQA